MSRPAFASEHYASRATRVLRIADVLVDPPKSAAMAARLGGDRIEFAHQPTPLLKSDQRINIGAPRRLPWMLIGLSDVPGQRPEQQPRCAEGRAENGDPEPAREGIDRRRRNCANAAPD
jgi:hypothetical protein